MTRIFSSTDRPYSYEEAVERLLKSFEEDVSKEGWGQPPKLYTVSMGTIAELASLTVFMSDALNKMLAELGSDLGWLVSRLAVNELLVQKQPESTIMDQLVEPGFLGWALTSETLAMSEDRSVSLVRKPGSAMQRIIVFCDVNGNFMTLVRDQGSDQLEIFKQEPGGRTAECLLMLVQVGLSSLVKRYPEGRSPV